MDDVIVWAIIVAFYAPLHYLLPVMVLLVKVAVPSVMKAAPPCQLVETLLWIVLLSTVRFPNVRKPPATSPPTLPLIVLRTILTVLLKKP